MVLQTMPMSGHAIQPQLQSLNLSGAEPLAETQALNDNLEQSIPLTVSYKSTLYDSHEPQWEELEGRTLFITCRYRVVPRRSAAFQRNRKESSYRY